MKSIKLLLPIFYLLLSSCNSSTNTSKVSIRGAFEQIQSEFISLKSTSDTLINLRIPVKDGKFAIELDIEKPMWFELWFLEDKCNAYNLHPELFLEPGDNIQLSGDASDLYRTIVAKGKGAEESNFLFAKFNTHYPECVGWPPNKTLEVQAYLSELDKLKADFTENLNKYNRNNAMNEHFVDFEQRKEAYRWAYTKCTYPAFHKDNTGQAPANLPNDFYAFLDDIDYSDEEVYSSKIRGNKYRYLVSFYFTSIRSSEQDGIAGTKKALRAIDEKVKSPRIKNILMHDMMRDAVDYFEADDVKALIVEYNEKITDEQLKVEI